MDFSFILKWILPLNLISTLIYFRSFFFLSFAVTFHFTFSFDFFFLLFNLRKTKILSGSPRPPYISSIFPRYYGLVKIIASQLACYEHFFCVLNQSCMFLFCIVLSIFFLNRSCIFTSSKHRNTSMVWNLRQTIFCFDRHMWINTSQRIIYLWCFYLF